MTNALKISTYNVTLTFGITNLIYSCDTPRNQKIKSHYSELSKRREIASLKVIDVLIKNGLFREELLKNEYRCLYKRIEVISNFWFSSIL